MSQAVCFVILVRLVSLMQARLTLHMVRAALTKFGLPAGHTKLNKYTEWRMNEKTYNCMCNSTVHFLYNVQKKKVLIINWKI